MESSWLIQLFSVHIMGLSGSLVDVFQNLISFLLCTITLHEAFVTVCLYYSFSWLQNSGFCTLFQRHDKAKLVKQNNKILWFYYFILLLKTSNDSLFLILLNLHAVPSLKFSITLPLLASINPFINSFNIFLSAYCMPRTMTWLKRIPWRSLRSRSMCYSRNLGRKPLSRHDDRGKLRARWEGA